MRPLAGDPSPGVVLVRAEIDLRCGRFEQAGGALDACLASARDLSGPLEELASSIASDDPDAAFIVIGALLRHADATGALEPAIAALERFVAVTPTHTGALEHLVRICDDSFHEDQRYRARVSVGGCLRGGRPMGRRATAERAPGGAASRTCASSGASGARAGVPRRVDAGLDGRGLPASGAGLGRCARPSRHPAGPFSGRGAGVATAAGAEVTPIAVDRPMAESDTVEVYEIDFSGDLEDLLAEVAEPLPPTLGVPGDPGAVRGTGRERPLRSGRCFPADARVLRKGRGRRGGRAGVQSRQRSISTRAIATRRWPACAKRSAM